MFLEIYENIKICDFGISRAIDITTLTSMTHGAGTIVFMTPDMFREDEKYDEKVDVQSFGVVMYFIVTKGQKPKFTGTGCYEKLDLPNCMTNLIQ